MTEPVRYWSLAMEGVPFGLRHPSASHAADAAQSTLKAYVDIDRIQIVEVNVRHVEYVTRPGEDNVFNDLFKGIKL